MTAFQGNVTVYSVNLTVGYAEGIIAKNV